MHFLFVLKGVVHPQNDCFYPIGYSCLGDLIEVNNICFVFVAILEYYILE